MTNTFTINTQNGIFFIEPNNIIRCEASSNYTKFYFTNGKSLIIAKTLGQCEVELCNQNFVRLHQSHLVNKIFVEKIVRNEAQLTNGITVCISRRKVKTAKKELQLK